MGKRMDKMLFPNGKSKALTLSYDDGVVQDRRLVALCERYGIQCTFNLGSGVLGFQGQMPGPKGKPTDISKILPEEISLYANQDIGGHGLYHSALDAVGTPLAVYEIIEDRRRLEQLSGRLVQMFAYPFGTFNPEVKEALRLCGYRGARTVRSTHSFDLPADFLEWDPTCHHGDPDLMALAKSFCTEFHFGPSLFFLWGHAYEFDSDDNWDVIETFFRYVSQFADQIWFASNTQILEYVAAYQQLVYSADGSMIHNSSAVDVWIQLNRAPFLLAAGQTARIPETPL